MQLGPHRLLLRPREGHDVRIESEALQITPSASLRWARDEYDNSLAIANFEAPTQQLEISIELVVRNIDANPLDFVVDDSAVNYPFHFEQGTRAALQPFLAQQKDLSEVQALSSWVRCFWRPEEAIETYALLWRLCNGIHHTLRYQRREQPGVQSVAETLARASGSCRDFARLFMDAARSLGLPSRFVSGYLYAPNTATDFGATHAWAEVYLPGPGWKGFDPTVGELVSSKHIAVAIGPVADAVPPIAGTFVGPPDSRISVGVWVTELAKS